MATASKLDKNELKRLMKEEKAKRIESPLAKYNAANQLTCVICNQVIKSELYWTAHVNSKSHLQIVEAFKSKAKKPEPQSKQQQQSVVQSKSENTSFKRPLPISISASGDAKKAKLDDMKAKQAIISQYENEEDDIEEEKIKKSSEKMDVSEDVSKKPEIKEDKIESDETPSSSSLPAGFFDDRRLDAKARNINVKETMDNEWEKFKKELKQEEHKNELLNEIDDEVREIDREIEEVDELIQKWSRIEDLHKRKEMIASRAAAQLSNSVKTNNSTKKEEESSSDSSDIEDLDEVIGLRLRAKKRY